MVSTLLGDLAYGDSFGVMGAESFAFLDEIRGEGLLDTGNDRDKRLFVKDVGMDVLSGVAEDFGGVVEDLLLTLATFLGVDAEAVALGDEPARMLEGTLSADDESFVGTGDLKVGDLDFFATVDWVSDVEKFDEEAVFLDEEAVDLTVDAFEAGAVAVEFRFEMGNVGESLEVALYREDVDEAVVLVVRRAETRLAGMISSESEFELSSSLTLSSGSGTRLRVRRETGTESSPN